MSFDTSPEMNFLRMYRSLLTMFFLLMSSAMQRQECLFLLPVSRRADLCFRVVLHNVGLNFSYREKEPAFIENKLFLVNSLLTSAKPGSNL
jgi:hypothetical protein